MIPPDEISPEVKEFAASLVSMEREGKAAGVLGLEALERLTDAALGHSGQSGFVMSWLASIYNGDALRVRLDDIRRLDWTLQKDLCAVVLGCNRGPFPDTEIREALRRAGGEAAVERLHWYTTGGAHRQALATLTDFVRENRQSSTARSIVALFTSVVSGSKTANLSRLGFFDDNLGEAVVLVLDALYGAEHGLLYVEDVQKAFEAIGETL